MKSYKSMLRSLILTAFMMLAFIPVMGMALGKADGSASAYATDSVVIGEYNWSSSVRAVNSKIVMKGVDFSEGTGSSFVLGIKSSGKPPFIINDDIHVTNETPAENVFSVENAEWDLNNNIAYFVIRFDAYDLNAGTYTADIKVDYDEKVSTNGYAIDSNNVITIPVSVTVTGVNPNYHEPVPDPKVKSISVTPGNGYNQVNWVPVDGCITYSVFRRDGKDANALSPELNKYKYLGPVYTAPDYWYHEEGYDDPVFVDHYAENNKEYSYIVIADGSNYVYSGDPSKSVSAKPGTGKRPRPAAPIRVEAYAGETSGGVTWYWDNRGGHADPEDNYGNDVNYDGEGYVDHFNVYLNGRLCKQIKQNASGSGRWSASLDFPVQNAYYTIRVTAVDRDGNESVPSNYAVVTPEDELDVRIDEHHAYYYGDDYYDDDDNARKGLVIGFYSLGSENYDIWRKPAGSSDGSYKKVDLPAFDDIYEANFDFFMDENVTENKAYTYKVIGHAPDGRTTEPYIFSVAAHDDEDAFYAPGGNSMVLSLYAGEGESATVHLFDYGEGTYRLYRNGAVINTWTNHSGTIEYTDTPPADGIYSYRMTWTSKAFPSLTVKSNTAIFVRDTRDVDPDDLEKAPGAPRLTGRIKDNSSYGAVTMSWTPDKNGGKPTGYIIYRTDDGQPNTFMWKNTSMHPLRDEPANGRYFSTKAEQTSFDMYIAWRESHYQHTSENDFLSPHNLWVVAYNELGISEPSNILSYSDVDGQPPVIEDAEAPGAPENVSAWTEWTDQTGYESGLKGELCVSWAEPDEGGSVKEYVITLTGNDGSGPKTWTTAPGSGFSLPYRIDLDYWANEGSVRYGTEYDVTVTAVNNKGRKVSSPPVKITPENSLAFRIEAVSGKSAALRWSRLKNDSSDSVEEYQIWRRANKSPWQNAAQVSGSTGSSTFEYTDSGLSPGTEYEYYIVAKENNGKLHKSVIRTVTTTSRGDSASAPTDFSAEATADGDVLLHWTPPAEGGLPSEYILEYQTMDKDPANDAWKSVKLSDAFGNSTGAAIMNWQYDGGHSGSIYSDFANYYGKTIRLRVRASVYGHGWGEHSDYVEFEWPSGGSMHHGNVPNPIKPVVTPGDGKVTISWTRRTDLEPGEAPATFYQLVRTWGSNYGVVFTIPVVGNQTEFVYVDDDTDIVNGRTYTYELRPCNSYYAMDQYGKEYWYHPWCYMYSVTVTPDGETTDQKIAGNVEAFADELIADKPSDLSTMTEKYLRKIHELKDNYESLTSYQRKLIGSEKCKEIEEFIDEIISYEIQRDHGEDEELQTVIAEISELPDASDITADTLDADGQKVKAARRSYDSLEEDVRTLVDNYSRLTEAEAKIKQLKRDAADTAAAASVSEHLEAIDLDEIESLTYDTLTDEIELEIANMRWEYNNLTKKQKDKVSEEGLNKLIAAEDKINTILGIGHIHDMAVVAEKAPTCADAGRIKYYTCRKCSRKYADPDGAAEITDESSLEIPADPMLHDWTEWAVKTGHGATCTKGGIEERECTICGAHEERSFAARDHSWNAGEITTEASETVDGIVTFTCTKCGETKTARITYGEGSCPNMYDHVWTETGSTDATCQTPGEIVYKCSKCNVSIKYETTIDPLAHDWSEWVPVEGHEASCTASGKSERHCRNAGCTEKETRIDEAPGHDWQKADDSQNVPADCAHAGSQKYECSRCDAEKTEIIPATNDHDWGEWKVKIEPSCTEAGVEERVCKNSDEHRQFRPAEPKGHDYSVEVPGTARAATCTTDGRKADRKCSRCGAVRKGDKIPASGHSWKSSTAKKATEFANGVMAHKCSRCGSTYNTSIPKIKLPTDLPKVKIIKPVSAKKKLTVKWKKPSKKNLKKIAGFEIRVTGPGYDKIFKVGKKKVSKKIGGLKSKKKYTVRIRAYKYKGKVKHVSAWSAAKKIKVK